MNDLHTICLTIIVLVFFAFVSFTSWLDHCEEMAKLDQWEDDNELA